MEVSIYLLALLAGHVLGDFYFQTEKLSELKDKEYRGVLLHSAEYSGVSLLVVIPVISAGTLIAAGCMAVLHWIIDTGKFYLLEKKLISKSGMLFLWDQGLHIASIFIIAYVMTLTQFNPGQLTILNDFINAYGLEGMELARLLIALLLLHRPANILIQNLISKHKPYESSSIDKSDNEKDNRIGRVIGTVERLIMFLLIAINQYAAIGLVLTAKSVARYDRISKDTEFAEYYLLGTLLSTACVIICRMLILQ